MSVITTDTAPTSVATLSSSTVRRRRSDLVAIVTLCVVPLGLYVPFALAGKAVLPGDDLTQNYPLRVLTGELLRAGHLPSWDSLIWSGTPLLAGWNAGAMFPGTWLFAILPGLWAWTLNYAAVGMLAGVGVYLLLRRLSIGPVSAFAAALVFSYTGFMNGQVVHLGLVLGTAFMPWILWAMELIACSFGRRRVLGIIVLALASALTVLAGDPRAVTSTAALCALYLIALVLRLRRRSARVLLDVAVAGVIAAAVSAIQWLPGIGFVHASQRGVSSYSFYAAGSMPLGMIGRQLLLPFLAGTNGDFALPSYYGTYNLPEVTIGVGFVAVIAACAYLPEVLRGAASRLSLGRSAVSNENVGARHRLGVWYMAIIVGVVLSMGSYTPLGTFLARLPFYGGERLQNRNAILIDFALIVLLGYFLDDFERARRERLSRVATPLARPASRLLALLPLASSLGLICYAYLDPLSAERALGFLPQFLNAHFFDELSRYLVPTALLVVLCAGFVFFCGRLSPLAACLVIALLVCCDVGTYFLQDDLATANAASLAGSNSGYAELSRLLGKSGRFAIFDPLVSRPKGLPNALTLLGTPDINILKGVPSVEGYGSIVEGSYQNATGTHTFAGLNERVLSENTFDDLDLRAMATLPVYFGEDLPITSEVPLAGAAPVKEIGEIGPTTPAPAPTPMASGPWTAAPDQSVTFTLPEPRIVKWVTVFLDRSAAPMPSHIRVGIKGADTSVLASQTVAVTSGQAHYYLQPPKDTEQIVITNTSSHEVVLGAVVAATNNPDDRILLDGALQGVLASPHWVYSGIVDGMSVFLNTKARGAAWLEKEGSTSPNTPDASIGTVQSAEVSPTGSPTMAVTTRSPATLIRSETYSPGWTATLRSVGDHRQFTVAVRAAGLLQSIKVPAGSYLITWRYAPRRLLEGLVISCVGVGTVLILVLISLSLSKARKKGRAQHPPIS